MAKAKVVPNSKESEMMILGCMLTSSAALNVGADGLEEEDFYYHEHQVVFRVLKEAYRAERPADVHLVSEALKRTGELEGMGGVAYLTTLAQYAGTSAYVEEYVNVVRNKSILRRMIEAAKCVEKNAYAEPEDVSSALDEAQGFFFQISQTTNQSVGATVKEILTGVKAEAELPYLKVLQDRQEEFLKRDPNQPLVTGMPSGFTDLDKLTNGFGNSNLIIVAARPSMGKTVFAVNIAEHICFKLGAAVAIFSLEMSAEELLHRMICSQSEVELDKIRTGSLDGVEYQRVVAAVNDMQKQAFIIDDQPGMKITDLRARARRLKEIFDIKFLVIDYLQLLSGAKGFYGAENRQNEISEISRMLKNLARELHIPIICVSQLSRKVEERTGHRPMLSDLRESGSIEQDADIVMLIFRREYYNPQDKPGMAEIIIAKNRHGSVGDVQLAFRKKVSKFGNYSGHDALPEPSTADNPFSAFSL